LEEKMRFSAPVLFAAALLVSGCNKKDKAPAPEPATPAAPAAPAPAAPAPPAPAPTPPAPAAAADSGSVISSATLAGITLPVPKGAPASGMWSQAPEGGEGDRLVNFVAGSDYWVTVRLLDCRIPAVKEVASKSADQRGEFNYCFEPPNSKLKDYPLFTPKDPNDSIRVVKAGHLTIIASLGATGETKLKPADVEAFLGSLDLAALAKL
jgi:hypothetical protein